MGNLTLSYRNFADEATITGGSWETTLPLLNLQNRRLARVARSTDTSASSTKMNIDFGTDNQVVNLVGLFRHNFSLTSECRITAGTTEGGSDLYDSGLFLIWPSVYLPEDLEWEDDNFWMGTISEEEAEGYPINLIFDLQQSIRARYWTIYIEDSANADGYVESGRLWMGPKWSPQINYDYGAGLLWEARSEFEYTLGGNMFFDERPPARIFSFVLSYVTETEAYGTVLDIQRLVRNDREVVLIPDPDDAARGFKRNFLGRMRRSDAITQSLFDRHSIAMEVEELL